MTLNQVLRKAAGNPKPAQLRRELQRSDDPEIILRRAVIGASAIGITAMGITSLFQTGIIKHLPDPPHQDFDSDKVNASKEAYSYGTPDGPLSILTHAVNLALATAGSRKRAKQAPWLAVTASLAAAPAAITAMRYLFYQMPVKEKAWCGYCVIDGLSHVATFGFTLYESTKAIGTMSRRHKPRLLH